MRPSRCWVRLRLGEWQEDSALRPRARWRRWCRLVCYTQVVTVPRSSAPVRISVSIRGRPGAPHRLSGVSHCFIAVGGRRDPLRTKGMPLQVYDEVPALRGEASWMYTHTCTDSAWTSRALCGRTAERLSLRREKAEGIQAGPEGPAISIVSTESFRAVKARRPTYRTPRLRRPGQLWRPTRRAYLGNGENAVTRTVDIRVDIVVDVHTTTATTNEPTRFSFTASLSGRAGGPLRRVRAARPWGPADVDRDE